MRYCVSLYLKWLQNCVRYFFFLQIYFFAVLLPLKSHKLTVSHLKVLQILKGLVYFQVCISTFDVYYPHLNYPILCSAYFIGVSYSFLKTVGE